jgi:3-oxoacyl-[acyl-carrier protein] reductase
MSLKDKVVLVTGASNGIGAAIASHLSTLGARLVINYRSDTAAAERLVASCGGPDRALAIQADCSKLPELDKIVAAAVEKFGRIDVAIANAGLMLMRNLEATTEEDFARQFDVNVKGPYFLAQV